jgi:hypothetical protein
VALQLRRFIISGQRKALGHIGRVRVAANVCNAQPFADPILFPSIDSSVLDVVKCNDAVSGLMDSPAICRSPVWTEAGDDDLTAIGHTPLDDLGGRGLPMLTDRPEHSFHVERFHKERPAKSRGLRLEDFVGKGTRDERRNARLRGARVQQQLQAIVLTEPDVRDQHRRALAAPQAPPLFVGGRIQRLKARFPKLRVQLLTARRIGIYYEHLHEPSPRPPAD